MLTKKKEKELSVKQKNKQTKHEVQDKRRQKNWKNSYYFSHMYMLKNGVKMTDHWFQKARNKGYH